MAIRKWWSSSGSQSHGVIKLYIYLSNDYVTIVKWFLPIQQLHEDEYLITFVKHWHVMQCYMYLWLNEREYRRGNEKWTIQRNWQHMVHNTKKSNIKTQHNMCRTPLCANKHKYHKQYMEWHNMVWHINIPCHQSLYDL